MKAVKEILSSSQSTIAVMTAELEVQNETIRTQNETIKALKEEMLEDEVSSKAELESLSATITALRAEVEAYKEKLETARAEVEAEKSKAIEVPRPRLRRGKRCGTYVTVICTHTLSVMLLEIVPTSSTRLHK